MGGGKGALEHTISLPRQSFFIKVSAVVYFKTGLLPHAPSTKEDLFCAEVFLNFVFF